MSFKVKALFEYSSPHEDDLQFPSGQIITVTDEEDEDWYTGEYVDDSGVKHEGLFPRNFVEKYEPVAPPRPTRTRPKKEPDPEPEPEPEPAHEEPVPAPEEPRVSSPPPVEPRSPPTAAVSPPAPKPIEPVLPASPKAPVQPAVQSPPKEAPVKRGPPPVSEKPASSSFKDRIAAFNKAAPPPMPFKPSGLGGSGGSSSFIKKPFVAPPPKGNTYVPQQRNTPVAPVYRREEDPEIKEKEAENTENAQKAGLFPSESKEADEDQPKPMSLKERMALLQKQQQEQAQRHAEAAAKKEKPKRPAKPRMPSHEPTATESAEEEASAAQPPALDRRDTGETGGRRSVEESHPPRVTAQPRRKPSRDPEPRDGNEADLSGAGELTEGPEELTEREDSDEKPHRPSRVSTTQTAADEEAGAAQEEEEEEEEVEEDEETKEFRRKEELRARMARLGGGMGMPGMFGMPMPGAPPSLPAKKKKAAPTERRESEDSQPTVSPRAPPVPMMMPLPGMGLQRKSTEESRQPVEDEPAEKVASPRSPPAGKYPRPWRRYHCRELTGNNSACGFCRCCSTCSWWAASTTSCAN